MCSTEKMQPIHIDEFAALASANGVKIARPLLTRFLDEQVSDRSCPFWIVFWSPGLTSARQTEHHALFARSDGRGSSSLPLTFFRHEVLSICSVQFSVLFTCLCIFASDFSLRLCGAPHLIA